MGGILQKESFRHEICIAFTKEPDEYCFSIEEEAQENTKHFTIVRNALPRTWGARGGPYVQDYSVSSSATALGPVQCPCSGSPRGRRCHGHRRNPPPACAQCLRLQLQSPSEWTPCRHGRQTA